MTPGVQLLDVSELEAPEPLVCAIAALEALAPNTYLHFCHRMRPCHLYGFLEMNGFSADTRKGKRYECEVFIWRSSEPETGERARIAASTLPRWQEE